MPPLKTNPSDPTYDVVIVGAGIAGAILAKQLVAARKRVLILEAGRAAQATPEAYATFVQRFYTAQIKAPNAPYPSEPNAPAPSNATVQPVKPGPPDTSGYYVQMGPQPLCSDYVRQQGGTTWHWLGVCPRMVPGDFKLQTLYGRGVDWPIGYDDLRPYYGRAEWEIGVSADAEDQGFLGITFPPGYSYPMRKIPQSFLDRKLAERLNGTNVSLGSRSYTVNVASTPHGRNSIPNPGYTPIGAVGDPLRGQRCEGNASCTPICPAQAKFHALKILDALRDKVDIVAQAVASKIEIDPGSGRVTGITYKQYDDASGAGPVRVTTRTATGRLYVIAAHAVETAKLLLASGAANSSGLLGQNMIDQPTLITWGLMPESIGSFRGPDITSNIYAFRDGEFRSRHAAFMLNISNWGWGWPTFAPGSDVANLVGKNVFGRALRRQLGATVPRQFNFQFQIEQLPSAANSVSIDPRYTDPLGNFKPVLRYSVDDYTRAAMAAACDEVTPQIFDRLQAQNFTRYFDTQPGFLKFGGRGYTFNGAGHFAGVHRMGTTASNSVVNPRQRTWDHENLYLASCGNMPTMGTSNPTLTLAALTLMAAENIVSDLNKS